MNECKLKEAEQEETKSFHVHLLVNGTMLHRKSKAPRKLTLAIKFCQQDQVELIR